MRERNHLVGACERRGPEIFFVADNLFGVQAEKKATEAIDRGRNHSHESRRLGPPKMAEPNKKDRSGESPAVAAKLAAEARAFLT